MTARIVTGMEKHRFRIFVLRSDVASGAFAGGGVPGLRILQTRFEMSVRSISAVAMLSSTGCSREREMWVQERALISNMVMFSKSEMTRQF